MSKSRRFTLDNLLQAPAGAGQDEQVFDLLSRPGVRIERIVSTGQRSADGFWYDQNEDEWILLLSGAAGLTLEGEGPMTLRPGDYLLIPAHRRHRVEWTSGEVATIWLAIHLS